jgi:hypothetical protein
MLESLTEDAISRFWAKVPLRPSAVLQAVCEALEAATAEGAKGAGG